MSGKRKKEKAASPLLAADAGAPGGAGLRSYPIITPIRCQDQLARLRQLAEVAKRRGDHSEFWRLRRRFLLAQAREYIENRRGR